MSDTAPQVAPPAAPDAPPAPEPVATPPTSTNPPEPSDAAEEEKEKDEDAAEEKEEKEKEDEVAKEIEVKEKEVKEAEIKETEIKEAELKENETNVAGPQSPDLKGQELKEKELKAQEEEAARVKEIKEKELDEAKRKWKELKEATMKERVRRNRGRPSKEDDLKVKQRKDAATTKSPPPEPAAPMNKTRTRTFTTHAGETLTVAELSSPTKPTTVPMTNLAEEIASPVLLPAPAVDPITRDFSTVPKTRPAADTIVIREANIVESSRSVETPAKAPVPTPKPIAPDTAALGSSAQDPDVIDPSIALSGTDGDVGFFQSHIAKAETSLTMQVILRPEHTDGATSQAFVDDQGNSLFTLGRRNGLLKDLELRDMGRMYLFGIHKRRFRLPRQ